MHAPGLVEGLAGLVQLGYVATAVLLGAWLIRRSRRSADRPALLLGLHFLLAMAGGYVLVSAGLVWVLGGGEGRLGVKLLLGGGYLATVLGIVAALEFTRLVFRGEGAAGRLAVLGFGALMALSWLATAAGGGFAHGRYEGAFWALTVSIGLANGWVAVEPLRYHALARRRLALGLAEPLLVNRFLLWGLGSLLRTGMVVLGAVAGVSRLAEGAGGSYAQSIPLMVVITLDGFGACLAYWLTFFPPAAYVRFVEGRARRA